MEAKYVMETATNVVDLYVPVDSKYGKVMNFKVTTDNTNPDNKIELISLNVNPSTMTYLNNDTILWYEDVERCQIFDTDLEAFFVNTKYPRPDTYKEYFHLSNYEGSFLHIVSSIPISMVEVYLVYEDLDQAGS